MSRRRAREIALQSLYAAEANRQEPLVACAHRLDDAAEAGLLLADDVRQFCRSLVKGVSARRADIDAIISGYAHDWSLKRMSRVDRNILRLGVYELLEAEPDVPARVAINEAVELARAYSTSESPRFINGILGRFAEERGLVEPMQPSATESGEGGPA